MAGSNTAQFLSWLADTAEARGWQWLDDFDRSLITAIRTGKGHPVGVEIYEGRPQSRQAKFLIRGVQKRLKDLPTVLCYVDDCGYSVLALRALLTQFYWQLRDAPVGSDEHCVYIDLEAAISKASDQTKVVAAALTRGFGSQEIGKALGTNGSRLISRSMRELRDILNSKKLYAVEGE